jgi:hypothetical protein
MKLIQIFALVIAMAIIAAAQNTNGQAGSSGQAPATQNKNTANPASTSKSAGKASPKGSSTQSGPITLTVKGSGKTSAATSSTKASSQNTAAKTSAGPASKSAQPNASTGKSSMGANGAGSQKAAVKIVTPTQKPPVQNKHAVVAVTPKKEQAKQKKPQVAVVPAKGAATTASANTEKAITTIKASGRRDPFMSIIRTVSTSSTAPNCTVPGKKCLYIPELTVKGIAKDLDGQMLAVVVTGSAHRAYFLRENDQVFNGSVEKITSDSVVFREFATDNLGRESAHEVVKKIPKT